MDKYIIDLLFKIGGFSICILIFICVIKIIVKNSDSYNDDSYHKIQEQKDFSNTVQVIKINRN